MDSGRRDAQEWTVRRNNIVTIGPRCMRDRLVCRRSSLAFGFGRVLMRSNSFYLPLQAQILCENYYHPPLVQIKYCDTKLGSVQRLSLLSSVLTTLAQRVASVTQIGDARLLAYDATELLFISYVKN